MSVKLICLCKHCEKYSPKALNYCWMCDDELCKEFHEWEKGDERG